MKIQSHASFDSVIAWIMATQLTTVDRAEQILMQRIENGDDGGGASHHSAFDQQVQQAETFWEEIRPENGWYKPK